MQTNIRTITKQSNQFIPPGIVLQGLLTSLDHPCNCGVAEDHCECAEEQLNEEIKGLQQQTNNIRAEVLEVERLLQTRDQLYSQLDLLREERDQIESEIQGNVEFERTQTVKCSGYKEMNERLRRRIYEVREYIQKMTFQNQKIEEGIISNQYMQQEEDFLLRKREVQFQPPPVYQGKRYSMTNLESMIGKIHQKQEEAWKRVRRQQQDIDRRNMETRMRKTNAFTYYSPKARTYYSPPRQIY